MVAQSGKKRGRQFTTTRFLRRARNGVISAAKGPRPQGLVAIRVIAPGNEADIPTKDRQWTPNPVLPDTSDTGRAQESKTLPKN